MVVLGHDHERLFAPGALLDIQRCAYTVVVTVPMKPVSTWVVAAAVCVKTASM
jgi:hypothetical protein